MPRVIGSGVSVSLEGFMAGPSQSLEAPLGIGGEAIRWHTRGVVGRLRVRQVRGITTRRTRGAGPAAARVESGRAQSKAGAIE